MLTCAMRPGSVPAEFFNISGGRLSASADSRASASLRLLAKTIKLQQNLRSPRSVTSSGYCSERNKLLPNELLSASDPRKHLLLPYNLRSGNFLQINPGYEIILHKHR